LTHRRILIAAFHGMKGMYFSGMLDSLRKGWFARALQGLRPGCAGRAYRRKTSRLACSRPV
jgi:hypothetical protein